MRGRVLEASPPLCARLDGSDPVAALPYQRRPGAGVCAPNPCSGSRPAERSRRSLPRDGRRRTLANPELTYLPLLAIEPLPHQ